MNDVERALSEISDIRSRLAASTRFLGYAPEAVAIIGLASLAVLIAQYAWPQVLAGSSARIALVWGAVLVAALLTVTGEAISRARREHGGMAWAKLRAAMLVAGPISIAGTVVGGCVLAFAPDIAWLLPGFWQMLIGIVGFASFSTMPRGIVWPSAWYVASGAIICILAGRAGDITPLLAGGPFIPGHLAIAYILHREGARPK